MFFISLLSSLSIKPLSRNGQKKFAILEEATKCQCLTSLQEEIELGPIGEGLKTTRRPQTSFLLTNSQSESSNSNTSVPIPCAKCCISHVPVQCNTNNSTANRPFFHFSKFSFACNLKPAAPFLQDCSYGSLVSLLLLQV